MRPPCAKLNQEEEWTETHLDPAASFLDPDQYRFLARQAIFDQMGELYGYELLFRSGSNNHFTGNTETATQTIVENWLLHGFERWMGLFPFFLNCTGEALTKGLATLLPEKRTVLELLETVEPSEEVVNSCKRLKRIGYSIALDDFQFSSKMEPLVELADYVKIDFRLSRKQRRKTLHQLEGSRAKLVAEKVETEEELKIALDEGFDLFQGYFLARPDIFSKRKTPVDTALYQQMLTAMTASWLEPRAEDNVPCEPRNPCQPQTDLATWQSWCA